MPHCNAAMKVTNEKKGVLSFCSHNMNKLKTEMITIFITGKGTAECWSQKKGSCIFYGNGLG